MATENVRQPDSAHHVERIELARRSLHQIAALLPIAQRQADAESYDADAVLGLLGRIRQMNDTVMDLLADVVDGDDQSDHLVRSKRLEVLGRREASHV